MMNYEELERKIEFIVNQQAQFVVDIDLLREAQSTTARTVSELSKTVSEQSTVVLRLAYVTNEGFKQVNEKLNALVDSQIRHEEACAAQQKRTDERFEAQQKRADERFEALTESQKRTEELLQKFLRGLNRRNGNKT